MGNYNKQECLLCEGEMKRKIYTNYEEPPESLDRCDACGYTEYYLYYTGNSTYIESCKLNENSYKSVVLYNIDEISREEYKKLVLEQMKKDGITVEDLIEVRKNKEKYDKEEKLNREKKQKKNRERWVNGEYTHKELLEIDSFLKGEKEKVLLLKKHGAIKELELQYSKEGLLSNVLFSFNEDSLEKYVKEKKDAQTLFSIRNKLPMFAPESCYNCGHSTFSVSKKKKEFFGKTYDTVLENVSLERASKELITGCPRCSRSYVD